MFYIVLHIFVLNAKELRDILLIKNKHTDNSTAAFSDTTKDNLRQMTWSKCYH